jgi:hypothetical protein
MVHTFAISVATDRQVILVLHSVIASLVAYASPGYRKNVLGHFAIIKNKTRQIKTVFSLLFHFRLSEILTKVHQRIHSRTISYGLRRDLRVPFEPVPAKIPVTIRMLVHNDISQLLGAHGPDISRQDVTEQAERMSFLREGIPTCYVAVTQSDTPCYMQWLMSSECNDIIQIRFNHIFPLLAQNEALLENAFTPATYRGMGIMSYAMAHIAKKAENFKARWVITFVAKENVPSLKGCKRAGFIPYVLRDDQWFLFRRKLTWTSLPEGSPYPFETPQVSVLP